MQASRGMAKLLMEKLVASMALNPLSNGVTLPLVVGQTCLCQSPEGAARGGHSAKHSLTL